MNLSSATNTNVELGASYMELGLYDEAIEEFRLALDDPGVSSVALYNIASCELKLGNPDRAVQSLTRLLQDRNAPEDIRRAASVLLQRVR
jgi:Tfp pilus assembly protein PilF